jgi:2-polyprenyl-3-methyl-5-hydroxy-6-metoxy-1,4-benzoquinol methylase
MITVSRFTRYSLSALILSFSFAGYSVAQTTETNERTDSVEKLQKPRARTRYKGRKIAQTMGFQGAPWLSRETRQGEENLELMLEKLEIKPGMTVCDMGCGNGVLTMPMAKMTGEEGRVLAVDIQPEMLQMLSRRSKETGLENIEMVLSEPYDPKLPAGEVDLILMVDVYHEFSYPEEMLQGMLSSLSENGVIALLEYRAEDPRVPIKPLHKMTKKQILKEYEENGFELVREFEGLPWQHMMFFGRAKKS